MNSPAPEIELSVVTVINDPQLYEQMRGSLAAQLDASTVQWLTVDADTRGWNAARALNHGIEQARGKWIVCVHQDVLFPEGWWTRVREQIARWRPRPALVGLMGCRHSGALRGHVHDPRGPHRWGPLPDAVSTVDEHLVIIDRRYGLRFDPACPGFHCYGADLALQTRGKDLPVIAIDAPVLHKSTGVIDASYRRSADWLADKWGRRLGGCIPTCAVNVGAGSVAAAPRRLTAAARRRASIRQRERTTPVRPASRAPADGLRPVVIVSYYFPPAGGAGTQRWASFVRWLPRHGFRPIVITAADDRSPSAPQPDPSLLRSLPPEAVVHRVAVDGSARRTWPDRVSRLFRCATDEELWADAATPIALNAAFRHEARAIITSVSPYACARIGRRVRNHLDVPWLLDLRDPWALDPWRGYPTALAQRLDLKRMRHALAGADLVVASTPAARRAYVRLAGLDPARVRTIPNGFEPGDFDLAPRRSDERFRLAHVGTLHSVDGQDYRRWPASGPAGDPTGRSGRYLLQALRRIRQRDRTAYDRIAVDLVGHVHPSHRDLAASLGVADRLHEHGYLPHAEALSMAQRADAIFVPLHDWADDPLVVPGKLYEAIATERFVLGGLPDGDAARLIGLTEAGSVCAPTDVSALAQVLTALVRDRVDGQPRGGATRAAMEPFTRELLTARLAHTLEEVIDGPLIGGDADPWAQVARGDWAVRTLAEAA